MITNAVANILPSGFCNRKVIGYFINTLKIVSNLESNLVHLFISEYGLDFRAKRVTFEKQL